MSLNEIILKRNLKITDKHDLHLFMYIYYRVKHTYVFSHNVSRDLNLLKVSILSLIV